MRNIIATKWTIDATEHDIENARDLTNRFHYAVRHANDVDTTALVEATDELYKALIDISSKVSGLKCEIDLAERIYFQTHPEIPEDRYFEFDTNGKMHQTTKERYEEITKDDKPAIEA